MASCLHWRNRPCRISGDNVPGVPSWLRSPTWSNAMLTKHTLQESRGVGPAQILNSSQVSIHPVLPLFTKWCINFYWFRWPYTALSKHWQGDCLHCQRNAEAYLQQRQVQHVSAVPDLAGYPASSQALPGSTFFPQQLTQVRADVQLFLEGTSLSLSTVLFAT